LCRIPQFETVWNDTGQPTLVATAHAGFAAQGVQNHDQGHQHHQFKGCLL